MKSIILIIVDGWGLNKEKKGNAIAQAKTPTINEIEKFYPAIPLQASGIAVGFPWGEAGNSEVGHLNMGAGRIVYQSLLRIVVAIKNGSFFQNPVLLKIARHTRSHNSSFHIMGLMGSGNVHSYIDHLYGLIEFAKKTNIPKVRLHVFTDGEDSPPKEAADFLPNIIKKLNTLKDGKIATVSGRFYPMDRNKNWDRIQKAYELMVEGKGDKQTEPVKTIRESYGKGLNDTFVEPTVMVDEKQNPLGSMKDNDAIAFLNFRPDRGRQLTKAFVLPDFNEFPRKKLSNLCFVTMTDYEKGLPVHIAFPRIEIKNHLTEFLSSADKKILKIAESEKYAHVTYFFNGRQEIVYPGEERILIPSSGSISYDKNPEMSASEITDQIIQTLGKYDLTVVNYANTDMVSHTGNFRAAIKAAETIDNSLKSIIKSALEKKCYLLITSDHGNVENMINLQTGVPNPEHTLNPVPLYLIAPEYKRKKTKSEIENLYKEPEGILADIAPTILELLDMSQPSEMTGESLLGLLKPEE